MVFEAQLWIVFPGAGVSVVPMQEGPAVLRSVLVQKIRQRDAGATKQLGPCEGIRLLPNGVSLVRNPDCLLCSSLTKDGNQ